MLTYEITASDDDDAPAAKGKGTEAVTVHLKEFDNLIRRNFRVLRPKVVVDHNEICYDLTPEDDQPQFILRVRTTISRGDTESRGVGEDSIKIILIDQVTNKGITNKFRRVHRVSGWVNNVRKRIEEALEEFEDIEEERTKRIEMQKVRKEQDDARQQSPDEFKAERRRQGQMLDALAEAEAQGKFPRVSPGTPGPFFNMRENMLDNRNMLLTPKQLAWAEREYRQIR